MNKFVGKASLMAALISVATSAVEASSIDNTPKLNGLKIAVIKDAIGTQDILSGNYAAGLSKLATNEKELLSHYDKAMGVCVASIKLNELKQANEACSKAITEIDAIEGRGRHGEFLKSLAYSNRAIVRYLAKDSHGALEDFTNALLVNSNHIVKDNILALKRIRLSNEEKVMETSYAD